MKENNSDHSENSLKSTDPSLVTSEEMGAVEDPQSHILSQLTAVQEEASLMKDQMARALADLENLRRRTQKEKVEIRQMAAAHVLEDLIPTLDTMRMGIASAKKMPEAKGVTDGFVMVYDQLKKALANHGLEETIPTGAPFDPNLQECVSRHPHSEIEEGHIIEVVRPGYMLNGRLLRPASVVISAGSESNNSTASSDTASFEV